jgi:hypothetical protein
MNKKPAVYAGLALFIFAGVAATHVPDPEKPAWKNLKVLPTNTSEDQMDRLMGKISKGLGVSCNYCHTRTKPGVIPVRADFVSDEKPEKNIARKMMRMTDKLNRKYFNYKTKYDFASLRESPLNCYSCHAGTMKPANIRIYFSDTTGDQP